MGRSCSLRLDLLVRPETRAVTSNLTADASAQTEGLLHLVAAPNRLNTLARSRDVLTVFFALATRDTVCTRRIHTRTGHTLVQHRRACRNFRNAVRRVIHRLRRCKAWSRIGKWFQDEQLKDQVFGLT